jgi:hypothetical protein
MTELRCRMMADMKLHGLAFAGDESPETLNLAEGTKVNLISARERQAAERTNRPSRYTPARCHLPTAHFLLYGLRKKPVRL